MVKMINFSSRNRYLTCYQKASLSQAPWRAQVVEVKDLLYKHKRLCIDYSQTINQYSQLDAYPLPKIEEMVYYLAMFKFFLHLSVYNQIKMRDVRKSILPLRQMGNYTNIVEFHLVSLMV